MNNQGKKGLKYGVIIGLALLAGVTAAFAFNFPGLGKSEKVKPVNGVVSIAVAKLSDGTAHYYRLEDGGKELKFFLVKGSDGAIHAAFDACDVCFREKKGYQQQGDQMLCKNCNQKFAINKIGVASGGGCNPSHLPARIDGAYIRVSVADLKAGAHFF